MNLLNTRIKQKISTISGVTPSIPLSNNHKDGSWLTTDIYEGEFFLNTADEKMWYRAGNNIKLVDVSAVNNIDDLNDVTITSPLSQQVLTYNSGTSQWINATASAIIPTISITYADLVTAIGSNGLIQGTYYLLTDFQTIHLIPGTGTINTATVEPLLLFATSYNNISTIAFSPSYPQDIINYNYADNVAEDMTTPRPGYITYRKDTIDNVECYFDWRTHLVRRHAIIQDGSYDWDNTATYALGDIVEYLTNNGLYFCYNAVTTPGTDPDTDVKHWIKVADLSALIYQFIPGMRIGTTLLYLDSSFADVNIFNGGLDNISMGQGCSNNTFFGDISELKFGSNCIGNTFYGSCSLINFGYGCTKNLINSSIVINFSNVCSSNTICDGANNNSLGGGSSGNIIGVSSTHNEFGNNCVYNYLGSGCDYNKFGHAFSLNIIGINSQYNIIDSFSDNNTIENDFSFNIIGSYFRNNTIDYKFINNNIGTYFYDNIIGNYFNYNIIGDSFNNNTIGDNCIYNSFSCSTFNNIIGNDFNSNNLLSRVYNINFSSATHVYQTYTCEIFRRQDGTLKLKYVNNSDVQIIVNATA